MTSQPTKKDLHSSNDAIPQFNAQMSDTNPDPSSTALNRPLSPSEIDDTKVSNVKIIPGSVDAYTLLREGTQPVTIGDFQATTKIGQGGMGAVYRARQLSLDREVALKVLARHLVDDPKFVQRFKREAKVMARLDHPNIIRCYSIGEEANLHYLAMEYVDGGSLQDLIDEHGKFSVADALFVTLCVADALRYAHDLNLVHRDIKPDNILLTKKGMVKVADLGLAKPVHDELSMTASGVGAGTPHYMAPEQMRSARDVDCRADIYALGGMLYVMLTGKKPFEGESLVKLLEQKEKGRIEPVRKSNPSVPEKLDLMIEKMHEKSLKARYQTCNEVIRDLQSLGLAGAYLSVMFPDGPPPGTPSSKVSIQLPPPTSPAPVKAVPAMPATSSRPSDAGTGEFWFIHTGYLADGRKKVRKLTRTQVKELIKAGRLDSTV